MTHSADAADAAGGSVRRRRALHVTALYVVLAALWILGSDWLVATLVDDAGWRMQVSLVKGWVFVCATAALLYFAVRRQGPHPLDPEGAADAPADVRTLPRGRLLLACAAIAALTGLVVQHEMTQLRREEAQRLERLAAEHSAMVTTWWNTRVAQSAFANGSAGWAQLYDRWIDTGDASARALLAIRLAAIRQTLELHATALLDEEGRYVAGDGWAPPEVPQVLVQAVGRAIATGEPQNTGIYAEAGKPEQTWLDVVVPVVDDGQKVRAVVVLRSDSTATLLAALERWPFKTASGRTLLVQRLGDELVGVRGANPLPVSSPPLLVARVIRGELPFGRAAVALDFRGTAVLGVVLPAGHAGWYVVARIDQRELQAAEAQRAAWIVALGLLAIVAMFAGTYLVYERRALAAARLMQHSQAARLRSLSLVQSIAAGSADAIFAKDNEGRYLLCNQAAADMIGRPVHDIIGRDDRTLFPAEQAAVVMANDAKVRADNAVRTYDEVLSTTGGTVVFLATKGPLHDDAGGVIGMFGISRDITERERQRQALQESEATKQLLLESMIDGMFVAQDRHFVFANAALARMLGHDPACFSGLPFSAVVAPESMADWMQRFDAPTDPGLQQESHGEFPFLRADGATRLWVESRASCIELNGRPAVLGVVTDITERRRAASALAEASELLQAVEDSVLDHMAVLDRNGHITAVNASWRRFALENGRASAPEASSDIGRDYLAACGSDSEGLAVAAGLREVLEGRSAHFRCDYPCHAPDRERWFQLNATPLRTQRGGAVVAHTDITEMRRAHEELERHRHRLQELVDARTLELKEANAELVVARDRAEAANRAKSAFLANMSHEIRTPMNAIVGLTHLLRRDASDPVQLERLDKVSGATAHLLQVINDILDLSKIEAGRLELEETDFSLASVLDGVHTLMVEPAQAKGIELAFACEGVPDGLRGDPTRLAQALLNLVSNAVKFTDKGFVHVRVSQIGRDADLGDERLTLRFLVRDTGVGIASDKLDALFTAFTQADTSTTRRFGGTGLGLAITQRLAMLMGGEVGATSTQGIGSAFWFSARLGVARRSAPRLPEFAASEAEAALRRRAAGRRVLLVEDNPVNQEIARELLGDVGLQVVVAANGAQALAELERELPALVLMDVQMPVMDGLEATRRLRAMPSCRALPVIAMTANAFVEDRADCLAAGMDDHLVKPVNPALLHAMLLRWLPEVSTSPLTVHKDPALAVPHLPRIEGLDVELAMHLLAGRSAVLRRVLQQFSDQYRGRLDALKAVLTSGDTDAVRRCAQAIKGAGVSIGAISIPSLAEALEQAIAEQAPAAERERKAQALHGALHDLVVAVDDRLAGWPAEEAETAPFDAAALARLQALLEAGDFEATSLYRRLRPALALHDAQTALRVDAALAAYEFEQALAALRSLREFTPA